MESINSILHDYQRNVLMDLFEEWRTTRSVMLQMPTGTGKTHVLAAVVSEECRTENEDSSVWIVAHRRELVAQIEETVARFGIKTDGGCVRVMSIQWLALHIGEMAERPRLVIIDEAHHAQARTYRQLWDECPEARFLGLTATPCRMNRSGFTDLFDVLITSWSIAEFIEKGQLSAFDYVSIRPGSREQLLIDSLEKRGADGDYQVKEMNDRLNRRQSIERLYDSVRKFADNKKGIVYAISIDHARSIADFYNTHGLAAVSIDSRTPAAERKRLVADFKAGRVRVLVNVDVFSEGFDCPDVEFVQMARPTLSLAKYLQQVGRGLRMSAGKEACTLIDNVGLYRVFGLPTVPWDWEAMFRGDVSGKGVRHGSSTVGLCCNTSAVLPVCDEAAAQTDDCDMETIVSHETLLATIAARSTMTPAVTAPPAKLRVWQDGESGLFGLKSGYRKTTAAVFVTVFDICHDVAAVRLRNNRCGLVNVSGEILWERDGCLSMKFLRNHFLLIRDAAGKDMYLDLHSKRLYGERPEVKRYGGVELLKIGGVYYSRTKVVYENHQNISGEFITDNKFCITIFDYKMPDLLCLQSADGYRCGYVCILNDDHESYYWVYRWLADSSVIITDGNGRFYHAGHGRQKEYIGNVETAAGREECLSRIENIAGGIKAGRKERGKEKKRAVKNGMGDAVPFCSGMKWGLKVGGHVTVPPIYRNVKSPVGRYCAVEKNYSQWGVIALDGTLMVEPLYSDIEISVHGRVVGTKVTGRKVMMKLP